MNCDLSLIRIHYTKFRDVSKFAFFNKDLKHLQLITEIVKFQFVKFT